MAFLDDLLGVRDLQKHGDTTLPRRSVLRVAGACSAVDDPSTGETALTLTPYSSGTTSNPAAVAADAIQLDNWVPDEDFADSDLAHFSALGAVLITGFFASGFLMPRKVVFVGGAFAFSFAHESGDSDAVNRIITTTGATVIVNPGGCFELLYDPISTRVRLLL